MLKGVPAESGCLRTCSVDPQEWRSHAFFVSFILSQASCWGIRGPFGLWQVSLVLSLCTLEKGLSLSSLFPHHKEVEDIQKSPPLSSCLQTEQKSFLHPFPDVLCYSIFSISVASAGLFPWSQWLPSSKEAKLGTSLQMQPGLLVLIQGERHLSLG